MSFTVTEPSVTLVTTVFILQDPDVHVLLTPHTCPQEPQLEASETKLMHVPLQQPRRGPVHFVPHAPQLSALVVRFTQVPPQFVSPWMRQNFDAPEPTRVRPVPTEEVVVEVVTPVDVAVVGMVVTSVGTFEQVDALQIIPVGQTFPHVPQLLALDASS